MSEANTKNALPAISPSSQLRTKTEAITGPFQFNSQLHSSSGPLLFLPESDHGFIEAVRWAQHGEPESHIEECAARIVDSITTPAQDFKEMQIYGMTDKDLTLLSVLESRTAQKSSTLCPGLHCLEVEISFLESLCDFGSIDADLIIARHILEHVRHFDAFLSGIRQSLKPGAFCLIEVPDSTRLFTLGDISQLCEEHTAYFTPLTLRNLVESWAFEVVYEETRVSDGEDLCFILIRASGVKKTHQVPNIAFWETDFLNRLPAFLDNLSSKLSERSVENDLWIYGASHISGVSLDLVVDRNSPVQGVTDDDRLKKHLHMSKMNAEVFPYDVLPRGKSLDVLVALGEGRAPNLYLKLGKRERPMCGESELRTMLTLGPTPLGDRFARTIEEAKNLPFYPLEVARCVRCDHTFIPWPTESDDSYSHYLFYSYNTPGLAKGFREIAEGISARNRSYHSAHIVDIGANDETWLDCFRSTGALLIAVEPASGPATTAVGRGLSVIQDYFSAESRENSGLLARPLKLVSMNYVFTDLPSPRQTLRDIIDISDESTVISIMTGYHPAQLQVKMFDYTHHEHLSYFTFADFENLLNELGLVVTYAREARLKGGSVHIEMKLNTASTTESTVFQLKLKRENLLEDPRDNQRESMKDSVAEVGSRVREATTSAKTNEIKVISYGASRSTTTLSYPLEISEGMDFIIGDNIIKHGRYAPGSAIPVLPPAVAADFEEALLVVLAWQHGPKILKSLRQHDFPGGALIPFPGFRIEVTK